MVFFFCFVSLSFISPATLLCSLHSKLICTLLSWDQAALQEKQPHTSWIMGRFVKTEIEVLFFWKWIKFHWTPYHSLLHFYSKKNPHPPNPLFYASSPPLDHLWSRFSSCQIPFPINTHPHTPSPLSPKPFLPLHFCLMMLCVTRIIQHHPQARNQTHTHTHTHQANKCRSCWTRHVNIKAKDRDKCKALLHTGLPYPSWNYYCVKPVKHLFIVMSSFCCEAIYIPLENEKCPCNKCLRGQRSYFWMGQIEDMVTEWVNSSQ